jgi:hypothetical protein
MIKNAAGEREREREVGSVRANGNSPCGENEAHVYKRDLSGLHGYRRDLLVMSRDSSCGQFNLTTSLHVVPDTLTSTYGLSMGLGFSILYAVSTVTVC